MANQDVRVSALQSASTLSTDDLALATVVDELSETGYTSKKITEGAKASQYLEAFTFANLNTTAKTIVGAINEIAQSGGGGGGGGSTVYLGTSAPSSATGSNADLYVQYTAGSPAVVNALYVKISGAWTEIDTGASSLSELSDTAISSPSNGQVMKYNSTSGKWENANESGGGTSAYFVIEVEDNQVTGNLEVTTSADDILDAFLHEVPIVAIYGDNTYTLMGAYEQAGVSLTFISVDGYQENLIEIDGFHVYLTESQGVWSASADPLEISNDIKIPKVYTSTLTAGNTSITISADVRSSSLIDVYTDTWGVNPTNVVADTANDTITLTFAARSSDLDVKVEVIY